MNSEQQETFLRYAEQLGHDRQILATHGKQESSITVANIDELRALVRPPSALSRSSVPGTVVENRGAGHPPALEERVEEFLYGNGQLTPAERKMCQVSFPLSVQVVSAPDRTMPHGETLIGPNGNPTVWNIGTMNFYDDSFLTVQSTYFTLTVQNLVMQYTDP